MSHFLWLIPQGMPSGDTFELFFWFCCDLPLIHLRYVHFRDLMVCWRIHDQMVCFKALDPGLIADHLDHFKTLWIGFHSLFKSCPSWHYLNQIKSNFPFLLITETSGCTFPSRWEGSWFQSGVPAPIHIKGSVLSNRGKCVASDGDKFLLVR